jgi:heat shock protein HslJ
MCTGRWLRCVPNWAKGEAMSDLERAFTEAMHRVDEVDLPVASLDPGELAAKAAGGVPSARRWPVVVGWLAAAAAVVLVAGIGVASLGQPPGERSGAAPGGVATASEMSLVGPVWVATQLDGQPVVAVNGQVPSLQFLATGELVAQDTCNRISGTYHLVGDQLSFSFVASPEIGCAVNRQQQRFGAVLDAGASAALRMEVSDTELRLFDESGKLRLVLQAEVLTSGGAPQSTPASASPIQPGPTPTAAKTVFDQVRKRADAPPQLKPGAQRVMCGEIVLNQGGQVGESQRQCLVAYAGVSDAELAVARPTTEGDLIISFYQRSKDGGPIRVYTSTHRDKFGARGWREGECAASAADSEEALTACGG